MAGTASVFAMTTAEFRPDVESRMLACGQSAVPGLWHPYAYINGGGMNLEWFRREMANCGRTSGKDLLTLAQLDALAAEIEPDQTSPMFVPHLGGRVCPAQPNLRGAWVGLTWSTMAHLSRRGRRRYAVTKACPPLRSELRAIGGGEQSRHGTN